MSFVHSIESLEHRTLLAGVSFNINFQPAGAAVPAYYKADIGAAYGMRANGLTYGWSADNTAPGNFNCGCWANHRNAWGKSKNAPSSWALKASSRIAPNSGPGFIPISIR